MMTKWESNGALDSAVREGGIKKLNREEQVKEENLRAVCLTKQSGASDKAVPVKGVEPAGCGFHCGHCACSPKCKVKPMQRNEKCPNLQAIESLKPNRVLKKKNGD